MVSKTQMIGESPASAENTEEQKPAVSSDAPLAEKPPLDPTRYGDWEKNGRCIDF